MLFENNNNNKKNNLYYGYIYFGIIKCDRNKNNIFYIIKKKHFYILVGRTQDKHIKQTW